MSLLFFFFNRFLHSLFIVLFLSSFFLTPPPPPSSFFFFFNHTAPPEISPLPLPDALPIWPVSTQRERKSMSLAASRSGRQPRTNSPRRSTCAGEDRSYKYRFRKTVAWCVTCPAMMKAKIGRAHV